MPVRHDRVTFRRGRRAFALYRIAPITGCRLTSRPVDAPRRWLRHGDIWGMGKAAAGERDQVGLPVAPVAQRGSPLAGAAKLVRVAAREYHAAVDDPRDDRR